MWLLSAAVPFLAAAATVYALVARQRGHGSDYTVAAAATTTYLGVCGLLGEVFAAPGWRAVATVGWVAAGVVLLFSAERDRQRARQKLAAVEADMATDWVAAARLADVLCHPTGPEPVQVLRGYGETLPEVRPRYGRLVRRDGTDVPLVFRPDPDTPGRFVGRHAGDDSPVIARPGDQVVPDALAAGQSVAVTWRPSARFPPT